MLVRHPAFEAPTTMVVSITPQNVIPNLRVYPHTKTKDSIAQVLVNVEHLIQLLYSEKSAKKYYRAVMADIHFCSSFLKAESVLTRFITKTE